MTLPQAVAEALKDGEMLALRDCPLLALARAEAEEPPLKVWLGDPEGDTLRELLNVSLAEELDVEVTDGQPEAELEEVARVEAEGEDAPEGVPLPLGVNEKEWLGELVYMGEVDSLALALGWGLEEDETEGVGEGKLEMLADALGEGHREAV